MKVFKIKKYHICYNGSSPNLYHNNMYALCGKERNIYVRKYKIGVPNRKVRTMVYKGKQKIIDYNADMDLCKTCQRVSFRLIVDKLKGK